MWSTKVKEDAELLALFEESARNVQRATALLRDLYAAYPERAGIARDVLACEHEGDPMMVIRWKDIYETLESAVDACETVANVLEGITLKRGNGRH
jgi:uncharacterized protein Yka (UPF0111/DUF47 family)